MLESQKQRDKIELFHGALIQHGPLSDRIYLMKLKQSEPVLLTEELEKFANNNGYTKIFAKVPVNKAGVFLSSGYQQEAMIPYFYECHEAALFLGYYLAPERQKESNLEDIEKIIDLACGKDKQGVESCHLPAGAVLRQCVPDDATKMSGVYRGVFSSYPFPIDDPEYITKTMADNIVYFGIEMDKQLVALGSSEIDMESQNVEMTDFATLPEFRGNHFAGQLLGHMEKQMAAMGIKTAYTIARAVSPGMNITFAKAGYTYGGRLVNNTNISGQIESMNVWYKGL